VARFRRAGIRLQLRRTKLELKGTLLNTPERLMLDVNGGIPLASCQDMLDSAPAGLAPLLEGMRMDGTFSLATRLKFDTERPDAAESQVRFVNDCRITAVPQQIAPERFLSTFSYNVKDEHGRGVRMHTGPSTPGWARYENISKYMQAAVLVNEDGRFFHHRGFDQEAISNSLRANVKARRFMRGASTITMQLAKNLYLEREKTLSRKLQEAVLTMLLEQELTKQQILELYLNVIEYGPGIYGIGSAAQYYFNTTPSELSLGQAFYLASILPNPKHHHFGADGAVRPGWSKYLRRLIEIAHKRTLITDAELEQGLAEQVAFQVANSGQPPPADESSDEYDAALFTDPPTE
jgi:monofunctional biosynthetic peptidoglycan transglycosylase